MRQLTLASVLALAGCGAYPAQAEQPDLSQDLKRVEEEQRRTGERVAEVRAMIESDQFEGIILALSELAEKQDTILANVAMIDRNQAMSSQQGRAETLGTGATTAAVMLALTGGGVMVSRRKKGG